MTTKPQWIPLIVIVAAGLVLIPTGLVLLFNESRYAGAAFGLLAAISGGLSLVVLIRASRQP
ncbi:hypothetical protein [Planctomonas psychrotolerans]|uniref:hypothetical protein n=1 Tax=Planctomonas psychrotolerans TaxID=2528712 RepID=UPI001239D7E9|nr:hypothetical protein [Planctomonas psychrotolerans]